MRFKSILASLCLVGFVASTSWAFRVPQDRTGVAARSVQDYGVRVLFTSRTVTPSTVLGSSISIFGILTSTPPGLGSGQIQDNHPNVVIRATGTVDGVATTEALVNPIFVSSAGRNTFMVFDPPVIAPSGFSVTHSSAGMSSAVFYNFLATGTKENFFIPFDNRGVKAWDPSLYGVQAASETAAGAPADNSGAESLDFVTDESLVTESSASITSILFFDGVQTTLRGEKGFLYGFSNGTGSIINYAVFEDSATTTGNTLLDLLPEIFYNTLSLDRMLQGDHAGSSFSFPWPVRYENGLTIDRGQAYTDGTTVTADSFRVYTRDRRKTR